MLAQNFKTATDLEISDAELDALIQLLGILERGDVRHARVRPDTELYCVPEKVDFFNMSYLAAETECGTAACLAGTADALCGSRFINFAGLRDDIPRGLHRLFCPSDLPFREWNGITPDQAATALRSYLTTGDANWAEALAAQ